MPRSLTSSGGGSLQAIIVSSADPWINLDGRLNAPTGGAQYPTYFTSLNGISPYPVRPPWHVAGVDYRVGINTGVSLKDPASVFPTADAQIGGSLGAGQNANTIQCLRDCTLDGFDFTLHGGYTVQPEGFNITISNSKLQNMGVFSNTAASLITLTMLNCEHDGLGLNGETTFGAMVWLGGNINFVSKYCWFKNGSADVLNFTGNNNCVAWYNLFDSYGWLVGAHPDAFQWTGDGTANNIVIRFNTCVYGTYATEGPSSFIDLEPQPTTTATFNNPEVGNNVASYTGIATPNITGAANNGSGAIRLTVSDTGPFRTNDLKYVSGVGGVPNATGQWTITIVSAGAPGTIDLNSSTFAGSYTSGGTIRSIGSIWYRQTQGAAGAHVNGLYFHDNYCDVGEPWQFGPGAGGAISDSPIGSGYVKSGNILLNSGGSF